MSVDGGEQSEGSSGDNSGEPSTGSPSSQATGDSSGQGATGFSGQGAPGSSGQGIGDSSGQGAPGSSGQGDTGASGEVKHEPSSDESGRLLPPILVSNEEGSVEGEVICWAGSKNAPRYIVQTEDDGQYDFRLVKGTQAPRTGILEGRSQDDPPPDEYYQYRRGVIGKTIVEYHQDKNQNFLLTGNYATGIVGVALSCDVTELHPQRKQAFAASEKAKKGKEKEKMKAKLPREATYPITYVGVCFKWGDMSVLRWLSRTECRHPKLWGANADEEIYKAAYMQEFDAKPSQRHLKQIPTVNSKGMISVKDYLEGDEESEDDSDTSSLGQQSDAMDVEPDGYNVSTPANTKKAKGYSNTDEPNFTPGQMHDLAAMIEHALRRAIRR